MAHLLKFPNDSGGYDKNRNLLVMPQNSQSTFYLVAGQGLNVDSTDESIFQTTAKVTDDSGAHKMSGLTVWEKSQNIRKILLNSGANTGVAQLTAKDDGGRDQIRSLEVMVVADPHARRISDNGEIESSLRKELDQMSLRQAVLRIAEDQISSRVKTNAQGCDLYHLNPAYGKLWCGAFAYWCWAQAALVKKVPNPFGEKNEPLLSPLKAIDWGMREETPGVLLQYKGPNPMTMRGPPQPLLEIGDNGHFLEPGDIALWRVGHAMGFKHVSFVESVNGKSFVDINGNAYDAGSGSALAKISHDDINRKLSDGSYKCFFLHVMI